MPCQKPTRAYQAGPKGRLLFNPPDSTKSAHQVRAIDIPCGTCILCRKEQARQQAVRISHEAILHDECSFVTLTYSDQHLPQYGSLHYKHLRRFWDRLQSARRRAGLPPLRYYAVGEYGDKTKRAHYHACVFGTAFTKDRLILKTQPHLLWTSPELEAAWGLGNVSIGALGFATARYTASYLMKKLQQKQRYTRIDEETGELIALEQPRAFMSRNLGKSWWDQYKQHVSDHDFVVIDGQRQKPPKAYDKWLALENQERLEKIKERRKQNAQPLTQEQRTARARNAHARMEHKTKTV